MSTINDIALGLNNYSNNTNVFTTNDDKEKSQVLEECLTSICENLEDVSILTEGKANIEYLLSIVGSYLIGLKEGELDENTRTPAELFEESLFPTLDAIGTIEVEAIEEDEGEEEDGEPTDSTDPEGHAA